MGASASIISVQNELTKPADASDVDATSAKAEVIRLRALLQSQEEKVEPVPLPSGGFNADKLRKAAKNGDLDTSKSHVAAAGDGKLDGANEDEETALMLASAGGHIEIVALLVANGANLDLTDEYGHSALRMACGAAKSSVKESHRAVVKLLCEKGASAKVLCDYGWTPLMKAAEMGYLEMAKSMLECSDVDINAKEKGGETALDKAKDKEHLEIIELFLSKGAVESSED